MDFALTDREREWEWVELGRSLAAEFAPRAARWDEEGPDPRHQRRDRGL